MSTRYVLAAVALLVVALAAPFGVGTAAAAEAGGCSFPVSETDATGTTVTLSSPPDRIVTLNPSAAQTIYEISASDDPAWDRVVGVSQFASYLPDTSAKTTVGNGRSDATVERTIALEPDLVLAPNTVGTSVVSQLRDAGLTVYHFESAEDLDAVVEKTRLIGRLVGECDGAADTANTMEQELDIVREALADEQPKRGLYYFFGFSPGSEDFITDIMNVAGLENIGAPYSDSYFLISAETIVAEDPQWVILNSDEYSTATVPSGPSGSLEGTTAYREGNAIVLDANEISQPAPRTVNAVLDIVKAVYPEAYREEIRSRIDSDELGGEKTVRSEALADGSVRLEARNLGRDKQVSFELPAQANSPTQLQRLNVTLAALNPRFTYTFRPLGADEGPTPLNGTYAFSRFSLESNGISNEDVRRLRFRFSVNESALSARNASATNVTLYRHNGTAWSALDTRVVEQTNGSVVFEANAPGSSTFIVGIPESESAQMTTATPTPTPTATPTNEPPAASSTEAASTTSSPTPGTTPTSLPGFGPVAALVAALVSLSLVTVRRRQR